MDIKIIVKQQGIDDSARKATLVQDTGYMVEKTYHIAPYLGAFEAYLIPQWPINGSKGVSIYKTIEGCGGQLRLSSILSKSLLVLVKKQPQQTIWVKIIRMEICSFCVTFCQFSQSYSLLGSFFTKTNVFLTRWKITWVDRHVPTIVFVYGNTFWTIYVSLRH